MVLVTLGTLLAPTPGMNRNDYAKIGKLVAGGALVAAGLWRRSLFGMLLMGAGGAVLQRTLRQKEKADGVPEYPSTAQSETEKKIVQEVLPPEIRVVHETDLDSVSVQKT